MTIVNPTRLVTGGVDTHLDVTDGSDVLFFGNITNHQADLADALRERALCGFPAAGGAQDGPAVRYVLINQQRTMPGERDGTMTSRVRELQGVLNGAGFPRVISANIDRRLQGPPRLLCRSHSPSTASDVVVEAVHSGGPFLEPVPLTNTLGDEPVNPNPGSSRSRPLSADHGFQLSPVRIMLFLSAEDQPRLTEPENRANSGRLAALSEGIADGLDEAHAKALHDEARAWLYEFISVLHTPSATVISFDYDTINETAVETHWLETLRPAAPGGLKYITEIRGRVRAGDVLRDIGYSLAPPSCECEVAGADLDVPVVVAVGSPPVKRALLEYWLGEALATVVSAICMVSTR